ncbi:MAG: hypothetical protein ACM3Y9_12050 [Ignavibacteria bacterium]
MSGRKKQVQFGASMSAAAILRMQSTGNGPGTGGRKGGHQRGAGQKGGGKSASDHGINQGKLAMRASKQVTGNLTNAQRTMAARQLKSQQSSNSPKSAAKNKPPATVKNNPKNQPKMVVQQLGNRLVRQKFTGLDDI